MRSPCTASILNPSSTSPALMGKTVSPRDRYTLLGPRPSWNQPAYLKGNGGATGFAGIGAACTCVTGADACPAKGSPATLRGSGALRAFASRSARLPLGGAASGGVAWAGDDATGAGTSRCSGPLKWTAAATAPTPMTAHPVRVLEAGIHMLEV